MYHFTSSLTTHGLCDNCSKAVRAPKSNHILSYSSMVIRGAPWGMHTSSDNSFRPYIRIRWCKLDFLRSQIQTVLCPKKLCLSYNCKLSQLIEIVKILSFRSSWVFEYQNYILDMQYCCRVSKRTVQNTMVTTSTCGHMGYLTKTFPQHNHTWLIHRSFHNRRLYLYF